VNSRPSSPAVAYLTVADNSHHPKTGDNALISAHGGGGNALGAPHFVGHIALLIRIGLLVILPLPRAQHPVTAPAIPTAPEPVEPKRPRSPAPPPFEGFTPKPPGALGARETAPPHAPAPVPPAPLPATHRRPRTVETSPPFWPPTGCDSRGGLGRGHVRAPGHPHGGPWRQCPGTAGQGAGLATPGPIVHGPPAAVERIGRGGAGLAAGGGSRATARGCAGAPNTVWPWWADAAAPRRAFAAYWLCALPLEQGQLDEV
jgi:hypothetical protein